MPPIAIASQQLSPESAVDIDGFLHMGRKKNSTFSFSRSFRSQFLPRLNKSQHTTLPFDIDHLVTLGKHTSNPRQSEIVTPGLEVAACETFALGFLPNESIDSLSSDDTTVTEVEELPNTPTENFLYPNATLVSSTNDQIMDIDQLIQIGRSSDTSVSKPVVSYRTLDIDQYCNQAVTTAETQTNSGIIEVDIEALPMPSSRHTFPSTRHSSLYPLDIDYLIQIGSTSATLVSDSLPEAEKPKDIAKSTELTKCKRTSSASVSTRHTKPHPWGRCVSKLKKLFFV